MNDNDFYNNAQKQLERGSDSPSETSETIIGLMLLALFGGLLFLAVNVWTSKETVYASTYIEAKHPFGSWFKQDSVYLAPSEMHIEKNSIFGDENITLPYSKIKEIILVKEFLGYKASFKYGDGFIRSKEFNLYMKAELNFDTLKYDLKSHSDKLLLTEKTSLLGHFKQNSKGTQSRDETGTAQTTSINQSPSNVFVFDADVALDTSTGLMWARNGEITRKTMNWSDAMSWANNLRYGGYNDWRLPTKDELASFVARGGDHPDRWFNANGFNKVSSTVYWSSSSSDEDPNTAGVVGMSQGTVWNEKKTFSLNVWPVRVSQ